MPRGRVSAAGKASYGRASVRHWEQWRKQRGLLPYKLRRVQKTPFDARVQQLEQHRCDVKGCNANRRGMSRLCAYHSGREQTVGHPEGRAIRRREWRPYLLQAQTFLAEQVEAFHASVAEALRWIEREIRAARDVERGVVRSYGADQSLARTRYLERLLRVVRNGVDAEHLLARWVAGELADDRDTDEPSPRFASDKHAAHQRARLLLTGLPFGSTHHELWAKRKREKQPPARHRSYIPYSARAHCHERWNAKLGLLAVTVADEIKRRRQQPPQDG
jgi:hypothetical protein